MIRHPQLPPLLAALVMGLSLTGCGLLGSATRTVGSLVRLPVDAITSIGGSDTSADLPQEPAGEGDAIIFAAPLTTAAP